LCTHHLEDAEKLCRRVLIMYKGKALVMGTPKELQEKTSGQPKIKIELKEISQRIIDVAEQNPHVQMVTKNPEGDSLLITVDDAKAATPEIMYDLVNAGAKVLSVNILRPSLEETYLKLIKEESR
jgi:ABC-2 type transport system ATP-binding protein